MGQESGVCELLWVRSSPLIDGSRVNWMANGSRRVPRRCSSAFVGLWSMGRWRCAWCGCLARRKMQSCDSPKRAMLEDWGWCSVSIRNGCGGQERSLRALWVESTNDLWVKLKYMALFEKKELSVER